MSVPGTVSCPVAATVWFKVTKSVTTATVMIEMTALLSVGDPSVVMDSCRTGKNAMMATPSTTTFVR